MTPGAMLDLFNTCKVSKRTQTQVLYYITTCLFFNSFTWDLDEKSLGTQINIKSPKGPEWILQ